jgi:hypothetical protein
MLAPLDRRNYCLGYHVTDTESNRAVKDDFPNGHSPTPVSNDSADCRFHKRRMEPLIDHGLPSALNAEVFNRRENVVVKLGIKQCGY